ncbi:MAG: hypothetical protein H7A33_07235 [Deltaproteobacteria bacterium]|nr:hypothetical protein [Deltaproteobacteria bacterium]
MGLRINTNVQSLQAQNNLKKTTSTLNQSLTRLSTGLRINTGSDDVVGLARSESLRAQIRGIDVALNNISAGQSTLGVAEGYLSQLTDIAQQMRETAVQAADSTISSADRTSLTDKFSSLLSEYNRLADGANFNGVNLLDGTFVNKNLQVGADQGEQISISITDARSTTIGKVAIYTSQTFTAVSANTAGSASTSFTDPGAGLSFTVGTQTYTVGSSEYTSDGVSTVEASESAISYVNAINSVSGETGVTATVLANVVTIDYSGGTVGLSAGQAFILNGVTIKDTASTLDVTIGDDDDMSTLVSLINDQSALTGVTATIDTDSDDLVLTATDGRNIHIRTTANAVNSSGYGSFGITGASGNSQATFRGTFTVQAEEAFTLNDGTTGNQVAGASTASVTIDSTTSLNNANLGTSANAASAITILDNVISQLQSRRADVGSTSNRLDIAQTELQSRQENLSSAESVIRDADIAAETARLTQNQILQQAGVTVLAQANASPQIALTLLQNI